MVGEESLLKLKESVRADAREFCREVGMRLPSQLESASSSEIRQHFGPFLERAFRDWAEREGNEVRAELEAIAERLVLASSHSDEAPSSVGPGSRLPRPALEVSTFASDASVVASLAVGLGALFANPALGGLFLLAAPALATLGRDQGERALRRRAAAAAMKAIEEATRDFSKELERAIDDFGRRIAPSA